MSAASPSLNGRKREARDCILKAKYGWRRMGRIYAAAQAAIADQEALLAMLEATPFTHAEAARVRMHLEKRRGFSESLAGQRRELLKQAEAWVVEFDRYPSSDHERAQLLGISHIAYGRFLQSERAGDGSLLASAAHGAETYGERETAQRDPRDAPLRQAFELAMIRALRDSPEFSRKADELMQEMLGPIPKYRVVVQPDGKEALERLPPELRVVRGGSDAGQVPL